MNKLLIAFITFLSVNGIAQSTIGYIDYNKVLTSMPEYKTLTEQYESMLKEDCYSDTLMVLVENYSHTLEKYHISIQSDSSNIEDLKQQIIELRESMRLFQEKEFTRHEAQIDPYLKEITASLNKEIEKFCSKYKIDFLSKKKGVIHCQNCIDNTTELISHINKK